MSQNAYHWEALRKQRVIDRRTEALKRREEYEVCIIYSPMTELDSFKGKDDN